MTEAKVIWITKYHQYLILVLFAVKRKTREEIRDCWNEMLKTHFQQSVVMDYHPYKVVISLRDLTAEITERSDISKWKSRFSENKFTTIKYFDEWILGNVTQNDIHKLCVSESGKRGGAATIVSPIGVLNKKGDVPWNKGLRGDPRCPGSNMSEETKLRFSETRKGSGNPNFGKKQSVESKIKQKISMRNSMLSGKYTPKSNNRNTHFESSLDGKKYRSSWECLYQYINPNSKYEELRIPYFDEDKNKERVYIVDFIDHDSKTICEVKPKSKCNGTNFDNKMKALNIYANEIGYSVIIANEDWIKSNVGKILDYSRFDSKTTEKLKRLCK